MFNNLFQNSFNSGDTGDYSIYNQGTTGQQGVFNGQSGMYFGLNCGFNGQSGGYSGMSCGFNGQPGYNQACFGGAYSPDELTDVYAQGGMRTPPPTAANLQAYIATQLQVPVQLLRFQVLTEPINTDLVKHACLFSLLELNKLEVRQLQYFDKASIQYAYCPNCFFVRYYVEKY